LILLTVYLSKLALKDLIEFKNFIANDPNKVIIIYTTQLFLFTVNLMTHFIH